MNKSAKRNRESRNEQLMFVKMSRSYFSTTDDKYSYKKIDISIQKKMKLNPCVTLQEDQRPNIRAKIAQILEENSRKSI